MADEDDLGTLALFFTFGMTFQEWITTGMVEREVAIYNELAEDFEQIYLFTYGTEEDIENKKESLPDNVHICPKKVFSNNILYSIFLPFLYWSIIQEATILKTNQMRGSWTAVIATWISSAQLVVRTGYIFSIFKRKEGESPLFATIVETVAYFFADGIITSSWTGYNYVEERYNPSGIHRMIPNYIDTDLFHQIESETDADLCYVGRLEPQKNVASLIKAVSRTDHSLTIIGEGSLRDQLESLADNTGADVQFRGRVPNGDLPEILNRHKVFVLPSLYEGMPKTLLEAMACGLPVVGTDVEGIEEVLEDGHTGLLCEQDPKSLEQAIKSVLKDENLQDHIGENARAEIIQNYSLDHIYDEETSLYAQLLEK